MRWDVRKGIDILCYKREAGCERKLLYRLARCVSREYWCPQSVGWFEAGKMALAESGSHGEKVRICTHQQI